MTLTPIPSRRKLNEARNKQERRARRKTNGKWPTRDEKYLRWIRTLPCVVCFSIGNFGVRNRLKQFIDAVAHPWEWPRQYTSEVAHVGARGLGQKCSDRETIPLCCTHHREGPLSAHRLQRKFWGFHALDRDALVAELNRVYEDGHQ